MMTAMVQDEYQSLGGQHQVSRVSREGEVTSLQ